MPHQWIVLSKHYIICRLCSKLVFLLVQTICGRTNQNTLAYYKICHKLCLHNVLEYRPQALGATQNILDQPEKRSRDKQASFFYCYVSIDIREYIIDCSLVRPACLVFQQFCCHPLLSCGTTIRCKTKVLVYCLLITLNSNCESHRASNELKKLAKDGGLKPKLMHK